tara:strand:- start:17 stop:700 length:684 start_codon:yes stop_codon:yes gene_type:complete
MIQSTNIEKKRDQKLIFENVYFSWPGKAQFVIENCNFSIVEPGLWMLLGKNGCGKSTILKLIKGIIQPTKGKIERPNNLSMVFQNPDHQILMPTCGSELILNIRENISKKDIHEKVNQVLIDVGLKGFFKRPVHTLSGGQKQKLSIASALVSQSNFILMDEPTALLDEFSQMQIIQIIKSLTVKEYHPITVLWITHRLEELIYADKASEMINGKLSRWQNPNNFKEK